MIFDPALAAAARRHQRAKNKAQKSPTGAENGSSSAAGASNNSTSTGGSPAGNKVVASPAEEEETNHHDGSPATAAAAAESGELGGSGEAKEFRVGEKEGSSSSVGDEATGSAGSGVGAAGTRSRTASGSSTGVDFEGATARVRAGGGASRQRPMKPRVLLKIVVLGCSNVRLFFCCVSFVQRSLLLFTLFSSTYCTARTFFPPPRFHAIERRRLSFSPLKSNAAKLLEHCRFISERWLLC